MELGTKILQYFFHLYPVVNAHQIKRALLAAYLEILEDGRVLFNSYKPALDIEIPADEEHKQDKYVYEEPQKSVKSSFQYERPAEK